MCHLTRSWLVLVTASRLFCLVPIPDPVLTSCQLRSWKQTLVKLESNYKQYFIKTLLVEFSVMSRVYRQKGPTRNAYAWQVGPFWQDTLDVRPHDVTSLKCKTCFYFIRGLQTEVSMLLILKCPTRIISIWSKSSVKQTTVWSRWTQHTLIMFLYSIFNENNSFVACHYFCESGFIYYSSLSLSFLHNQDHFVLSYILWLKHLFSLFLVF